MHQAVRTQIYLPKDLRSDIDSARKWKEESLSDYLRKAAKAQVEKDKKTQVDLKKLAKDFVGSINPSESGWAGIDIDKWQREIRKDRKII